MAATVGGTPKRSAFRRGKRATPKQKHAQFVYIRPQPPRRRLQRQSPPSSNLPAARALRTTGRPLARNRCAPEEPAGDCIQAVDHACLHCESAASVSGNHSPKPKYTTAERARPGGTPIPRRTMRLALAVLSQVRPCSRHFVKPIIYFSNASALSEAHL